MTQSVELASNGVVLACIVGDPVCIELATQCVELATKRVELATKRVELVNQRVELAFQRVELATQCVELACIVGVPGRILFSIQKLLFESSMNILYHCNG